MTSFCLGQGVLSISINTVTHRYDNWDDKGKTNMEANVYDNSRAIGTINNAQYLLWYTEEILILT